MGEGVVQAPGKARGELLAPPEHLRQLLKVAAPEQDAVLHLGWREVDGPLQAQDAQATFRERTCEHPTLTGTAAARPVVHL